MRVRVIGGSGGWPARGQACSGYLVERDGFRLLLDPGYGVALHLPEGVVPGDVDAVYVSHGHPDHYADLHPLLRARVLNGQTLPPLPVYSLPGAVSKVLELDGLGELDGAHASTEFGAGESFQVGPFGLVTFPLIHFVPNAGVRISAGGQTVAYTGDTGPAPELENLAEGADLLIAEATHPYSVPERSAGNLSSAWEMGQLAGRVGVERLLLAHLWPGSSRQVAVEAAREVYDGEVQVAVPDQILELD
jgi:ribonuclease BN (tRNA processing enzyme)